MNFIDDSQSFQISPTPDISYRAGMTMARFQLLLNQLPENLFHPTIENFHNPHCRITDFMETIKDKGSERYTMAINEINFAVSQLSITEVVTQAIDEGLLNNRITHNDTKLDNILFQKDKESLVIDLDTVMPGSIIFDFGDMVRSIVSTSMEDERDLRKVGFNIEHFDALSKGYLGTLKDDLSITEKELIYPGIICIIYIQGIRFLSDFLVGDKYYKTGNKINEYAYETKGIIRYFHPIEDLKSTFLKNFKIIEIEHDEHENLDSSISVWWKILLEKI